MTVVLPQHADQHGPQRPVLLAIDQQLGEGACRRVPPELADAVGTLEVGEHEDVEQLRAGSGAERVQALTELQCAFVRTHPEETSGLRCPGQTWFLVSTAAFHMAKPSAHRAPNQPVV
jgi:hypothetical protein